MRKLIVAGIITVVGIIVWISYLKYDVNRFNKELPLKPETSSPSERQAPPVKDASETAVDGVTQNEQTSLKTSPEETLEDVVQNDINADSEMERSGIESGLTQKDVGISPELEKVFIAYNDLYAESLVVGKQLSPLLDRTVQVSSRMREIDHELSTTRDPAKLQSLYNERDEIDAWIEKNKPNVIELQNELRRIRENGETLMKEHGFSSTEDFLKIHWEAYKAWRATQ